MLGVVGFQNHAGREEWRTDKRMQDLARKSPRLYVIDGERWRCPPAEEFAASYGPSELNETFVANYEFIKRYYHKPVNLQVK
jgi:hypothetical protein